LGARGLSAQPPPPQPPSGHGPFGNAAFKGALILCLVLIGVGVVMIRSGNEDVAGVGLAFVVLAGVGLLTGIGGVLLERHLQRRSRW
jgi:hypothetical protein